MLINYDRYIDLHSGLQVLIAIVGDLMFQLLVGTCLVSHSQVNTCVRSRFYLLDGWRDRLEGPHGDPSFDFLEVFAGKHLLELCLGASSKLRRLCFFLISQDEPYGNLRHDAGYRCASYDRDFHTRAMDFSTSPGWLFLICKALAIHPFLVS